MTKLEISEGNELIAIFAGGTPIGTPSHPVAYLFPYYFGYKETHDEGGYLGSGSDNIWAVDEMLYHNNWEWTMPVVDTINNMGKAYGLAIFKTYVSLTVEKAGQNKFHKDFGFAHSEYITAEQTGKVAMFKLLVKFVKWHNEQESVAKDAAVKSE